MKFKKTRPCLVLTNNILNRLRKTAVVVPLSSSARANPPLTVPISYLKTFSVAIIDQIRAVGKHRFKSLMSQAQLKDIEAVEKALKTVLDFK